MKLFSYLDKAGSLGVLASAFGCIGCFPALATISASLGLGVISGYDVVAITILMPTFAGIAFLVNLISWYRHRSHVRGALSVLGPSIAFAMLFPRIIYIWNTNLFYGALVLMLSMSVYDLVNPPKAKPPKRIPDA